MSGRSAAAKAFDDTIQLLNGMSDETNKGFDNGKTQVLQHEIDNCRKTIKNASMATSASLDGSGSQVDIAALLQEKEVCVGLASMNSTSIMIVDILVELKRPIAGKMGRDANWNVGVLTGKALQQVQGYVSLIRQGVDLNQDLGVVDLMSSENEELSKKLQMADLLSKVCLQRVEGSLQWPAEEERNVLRALIAAAHIAALDTGETIGGAEAELVPLVSHMVKAKYCRPTLLSLLNMLAYNSVELTSLLETEGVSHSLATEGYFQEMLKKNMDVAEGYIEMSICRALQALCIVFLYEMCVTSLARAMHDKRKKSWDTEKPLTAHALKLVSQMHKKTLDGKADSTVRAEIQADFAYSSIFMHLFQPGPQRKRKHTPSSAAVHAAASPRKEPRAEGKPKSAPNETGRGASAEALLSLAAVPERIPGRESFLRRLDSMERGIHEMRAALAGVTALLEDVRSERQKQTATSNIFMEQAQGLLAAQAAMASQKAAPRRRTSEGYAPNHLCTPGSDIPELMGKSTPCFPPGAAGKAGGSIASSDGNESETLLYTVGSSTSDEDNPVYEQASDLEG